MTTPTNTKAELNNNSNDNNEIISYASSLASGKNNDDDSLSSGLSVSEAMIENTLAATLQETSPHELVMTSQQSNYSEKLKTVNNNNTNNNSYDAVPSLMTLFDSPVKDDNDTNQEVIVRSPVDENENYEVEVSFEPMAERRMTERMSNSNSAVQSRDGSVCGIGINRKYDNDNNSTNHHDIHYNTSVETDHLLNDTRNIIQNQQQSKYYGNLENEYYTAEDHDNSNNIKSREDTNQSQCKACFAFSWESIKATINGSVMFILFHILFCLAQASAIHRPHSSKSVLGAMTRMSALGPIVAGPLYVYILGDQYPALYPTIDAFPAPFLVQQALIVDEMLYANGKEDDENLFMTTFCLLSGLGLIFTGMFLFIGTKFKLANLGAYLPYPVMAGFFSTVGFLGWTLAFSVDTGKNIGEVFRDANWDETKRCLVHHIPSVIIGVSISVFASGPRKSWTPLFVLGTVPIVFGIMYITGTSLDEAREYGWFWKRDEFESAADSSFYKFDSEMGFSWNPPLPFGVLVNVLKGNVYMPAFWKGLPVSLAMGLMYLLRCSLHVPALQKNSENLLKWDEDQKMTLRAKQEKSLDTINVDNAVEPAGRERTFSEESCYNHDDDKMESNTNEGSNHINQPYSVSDVYLWYARCLTLSGLAGGSATIPSMGASITLFKIGARGKAPQYGSIVLLVFFYMNKFELVGYFPRIVFSTLLFISSTDLLNNWFILSYQKTADKGEWLIAPILSLFAFVVGVLPAVAFGMALSTILFVGTFYKSGVVKFIATGKTVHSTTERNIDDDDWLDENGDLIQVLVLQNYLFFGNANSVKEYVTKIYQKVPLLLPKYVIIDMSLVTGMDTSAVEIFSDIVTLCFGKKSQVFFAGLSSRLMFIMKRGGVKPSADKQSKFSILRFPPTMESALMKAEDGLLKFVLKSEEREIRLMHNSMSTKNDDDGFLKVLALIDRKHRINMASKLKALRAYTSVVTLQAGESLFSNLDGSDKIVRDKGLFFVENGIMRVERDAFATNTRTWNTTFSVNSNINNLRGFGSLTNLRDAWFSTLSNGNDKRNNVRIARFGSGWIVGTLDGISGIPNPSGIHVAVTPCRLHLLPYTSISKLEEEDPALILKLFKLMSYITSRRQEATIKQLATLQTIMNAPPTFRGSSKKEKVN